MRALSVALTLCLALVPRLSAGQGVPGTNLPYEKLPDWSGVWAMVGGTVFCGGRLRLVALLEAGTVTARILRHMGLPSEVPAARPARAPPLSSGDESC